MKSGHLRKVSHLRLGLRVALKHKSIHATVSLVESVFYKGVGDVVWDWLSLVYCVLDGGRCFTRVLSNLVLKKLCQ